MLSTIQTQQIQPVRAGKLEVRLATTLPELDAAMRLRFEVFNLELQEGLQSSYERGYDTDAYDVYCDHLIVKDLELDEVVGTYRLLRQAIAEQNIGFYSENEFDLSNLKHTVRRNGGELLELGRSCIAASHRSFGTINLLWGAIARYAVERDIRCLFGCGSMHVSDPKEVRPIYSHLRTHYFAPEPYRVFPLAHCRMNLDQESEEIVEPRTLQRKLSPILKGY
ncbi:MAG TPA: GNAT family N-acyltransferase, partial [Blastocatellia bacterium]|nr:GNAT family N-acyltransferase [Blastocatellia bacterium]